MPRAISSFPHRKNYNTGALFRLEPRTGGCYRLYRTFTTWRYIGFTAHSVTLPRGSSPESSFRILPRGSSQVLDPVVPGRTPARPPDFYHQDHQRRRLDHYPTAHCQRFGGPAHWRDDQDRFPGTADGGGNI